MTAQHGEAMPQFTPRRGKANCARVRLAAHARKICLPLLFTKKFNRSQPFSWVLQNILWRHDRSARSGAGAVCVRAFCFLLGSQTVNLDYVSCAMAAEPFCKQVFLAHVGRSRSRLHPQIPSQKNFIKKTDGRKTSVCFCKQWVILICLQNGFNFEVVGSMKYPKHSILLLFN